MFVSILGMHGIVQLYVEMAGQQTGCFIMYQHSNLHGSELYDQNLLPGIAIAFYRIDLRQ